jgi:hypothetical protein
MLLHASHNLFLENIFDPLTMDTEHTRLITGESGIGLAVVGIVVRVSLLASTSLHFVTCVTENGPYAGEMTHR